MPGRPPREWFQRCADSVASRRPAADAAAVCGAVWTRKSKSERRALTRAESPMATKRKTKKKKHSGNSSSTKTTARRKATGKKPRSAEAARRKTQRAPARNARVKHETRCANCGHAAAHVKGRGCLHFEGKRFCPCKHRS